jgi:arabinogalactan endo-1,4-beta-galactosidase
MPVITRSTLIAILLFFVNTLTAQCLITGADLSYVNTIEQNGGTYTDDDGTAVDPFAYFAQRGTKMVRLRLWHTPENFIATDGNPITSSSLDDVLQAADRAVANGMDLNIAIHYGDYFNDPGKQLRPAAWQGLSHEVLLDSIYQYTYLVLEKLYLQNTVPAIVAIGNETTWGFVDESVPTNGFSWPQDAEKFNAGLNAVDDFNSAFNQNIKKALHFTESTATWLSGLFEDQGITNYDIIGISYYPNFSEDTDLQEIGQLINNVSNNSGKEVMIFETGFIWTNDNGDNYGNFIGNNGNVLNYPISAAGQRSFLLDLANIVYDNGGTGLFYWEPAWISSDMADIWGQGSSYENASLFNFNNNNSALPGFDFFDFCTPNAITTPFLKDLVVIFPNPTNGYRLNIEAKIELSSWKLFDITGKVISEGQLNNSSTIAFDPNLTGVFYLELWSRKKQKIITKIIL